MEITRRSFLTCAAAPYFMTLADLDAATAQLANPSQPAAVIHDASGKQLLSRGVGLVDWDGYIANPAIKLTLSPPPDIAFPATTTLATIHPRMYFDMPSTVSRQGPRKTVTFSDQNSTATVFLSIFPDRHGMDFDDILWVQSIDANGAKRLSKFNIHVFDQNENTESPFKITLDYTYDTVGFFDDQPKRKIVQQAADDWAYFIGDMKLDPVMSGTERIWIFPPTTDFSMSNLSPCPLDYTGFLMELYGVDDPQHRCGGEASDQTFQKSFGEELPLRRSGNVAFETQGNWNTLGWATDVTDDSWWRTDNRGDHQNDLYSIAHHEMGHSLFFNSNYPQFASQKAKGVISSSEIHDYHAKPISVDGGDHFTGEIDDDSLHPAFGNEYNGHLPEGRWLITKLDILAAESVGYKVRKTFDLSVPTQGLPGGYYGMKYQTTLRAKGGVPWYRWSLEAGNLPNGITLDPLTGQLSGTPKTPGNSTFVVLVRDSSQTQGLAISKPLTISVI